MSTVSDDKSSSKSYDSFSADYDRFVNWESRLAYELPFLERQLKALTEPAAPSPPRILDAACGTGMHAIALAKRGYQVAGADLSSGMIVQARANAEKANVEAGFVTAGFGDLAQAFGKNRLFPFDAVLCLGNSLPHLPGPQALVGALADFGACLRPGGLVIIQNRNFDAVMVEQNRWMEPQSFQEGNNEWIFLRFYDFLPDEAILFNILTLHRREGKSWTQQITSTYLYPQRQALLSSELGKAGFIKINAYGNMAGDPFSPQGSGNLVITAEKPI